jgi:hypothetical protein
MWHMICLCLPAVTKSEQDRFFTLFKDALRARGEVHEGLDLSLFFLRALSAEESLTVLEERLNLVVRSQELLEATMEWEERGGSENDSVKEMIDDHMRSLLEAESIWLQRTIGKLHAMQVGVSE